MKRSEQKQPGQDICYCDKGIQPKDEPATEYRCEKCGGIVWPKGMGAEER